MMRKIKLHQYIPLASPLHQLAPAAKFGLFLLSLVIMTLVQSIPALLVALCGLGLVLWQTKVPWWQYWRLITRLKWLFLFVLLLNCFFLKQGVSLFTIGSWSCYSGAIQQTIKTSFQLVYMMLSAGWLVYTTSPLELMEGLDWYLRPLQKIGLRTERMTLILFIVFRFIPILLQDFEQLQYAQAARGAYIYQGSLKQRLQSFPALLVPLFETALAHAQQNAKMLLARGYDNGKRFQLPPNKRSRGWAWWLFFQFITIILMVIWFNYQGLLL